MSRVVAVLGPGPGDELRVRTVPADTPILRADDSGILRGDGIFESLHIRHGRAWLLDEHLARLARSATLIDLPLPAPAKLAELAAAVIAAWPPGEEGRLRIICTRGPEDAGAPPTVFAIASPIEDEFHRLRAHGASVVTASLGL